MQKYISVEELIKFVDNLGPDVAFGIEIFEGKPCDNLSPEEITISVINKLPKPPPMNNDQILLVKDAEKQMEDVLGRERGTVPHRTPSEDPEVWGGDASKILTELLVKLGANSLIETYKKITKYY